jgi:hypothetical protein
MIEIKLSNRQTLFVDIYIEFWQRKEIKRMKGCL